MPLDHCYELSLLLSPSGPKKNFFKKGTPVTYFASQWIRPLADMAKTSLCMSRAMSTSPLPSFGSVVKGDFVFPYIYMHKCPPPFFT